MHYRIELKSKVRKQLEKIPKKEQKRILVKIHLLANDPYPQYSKPLKGRDDRSMRVGNYRVLYDVYENRLVILVLAVGHRKAVYRQK